MHETRIRTVDELPTGWEVTRLAQRLRANLSDLSDRHGVDSIALFGSYVRNEQHPDSDLDVLVTFHRTPSLFGLMRVEDDISSIVGVPVDLLVQSSLQPRFARYVQREAVSL